MKRAMLILFSLFLISTGETSAIEPIVLPPFTVQSLNNTPVKSNQLSPDSRWILLYLTWDCRHCDDTLHDLEVFQNPLFSRRVVIVVGGGASETVYNLIGPREKIASLGWFTDPEWEAYKVLPISGIPIVFGIKDGRIEWSLGGTPWDSKTTRSILLNWVNY